MRYNEILIENHRLNLLHLYFYLGGNPGEISPGFLASENWSTWAIVRRCLHDSTFSRSMQYRRVTDEQTDKQTDEHKTTAYTALA